LKEIDTRLARYPRRSTPTKTAANQYEIAHTGPYNYTIFGRGHSFEIDGYRGTTILEAKHVGDFKSSPYVPGSKIPDVIRQRILDDTRDELFRVREIIRSGRTPFKSFEIITNTPESKAFFEGLLKEYHVPGKVRLAI
jgi:hypothetical protein